MNFHNEVEKKIILFACIVFCIIHIFFSEVNVTVTLTSGITRGIEFEIGKNEKNLSCCVLGHGNPLRENRGPQKSGLHELPER